MNTPAIQFDNVSKLYPGQDHPAIDKVSFSINTGETLVIVGTSGCGKTTLLKMINRLHEPSTGTVYFNGRDVATYNLEMLRHAIGYVFQGIGLFPHMTVGRNISIVLELMHKPQAECNQRANELLQLMDMDPEQFISRFPSELSGGQQQRIGVARALAANPDCLLMDEPFGALDPITRKTMQEEILALKEKLNKTIVFVTHDIDEAFRLADRIAVMHEGVLHQIGTKREIVETPATEFVETLVGL